MLIVGSFVTHAKLPELGSGEIVVADGQRVSIRFASGERNFVYALVEPYLTVTAEAPVGRPSKPGRAPKAAKKSR